MREPNQAERTRSLLFNSNLGFLHRRAIERLLDSSYLGHVTLQEVRWPGPCRNLLATCAHYILRASGSVTDGLYDVPRSAETPRGLARLLRVAGPGSPFYAMGTWRSYPGGSQTRRPETVENGKWLACYKQATHSSVTACTSTPRASLSSPGL